MIKAKKSLGQNFLIDKNIINKIVNTVKIDNKTILEVGPGTGNLTNLILNKNPKKMYVIEKDDELIDLLNNDFKDKIEIIHRDILEVNENTISENKLIVFGNLPYNISTEILCKWILNLKNDNYWFTDLVLMFQKEVADRIISRIDTKNYSRLTILSNWRLNIKKICEIKPSSFSPRPKIDSVLLHFVPKKKFHLLDNPKNLETITRTFFEHRRKMIKKPFNKLFNGNKEIIKKLNLDLDLRPQNINIETYLKLASEYENLLC